MNHYSSEAVFRFQVVAQVLSLERAGAARAHAVEEVASRTQITFQGQSRLTSTRTIYRWLVAYERQGGIAGLEKARRSGPVSKVLPELFVKFLEIEKKLDPRASIPELIERGREYGLLEAEFAVHRVTVYRTCVRLGVAVARVRGAADKDTRRFAYPHRMDMVLCDGKHFRAGATRARRVALFFLDDATRFVLHVVVGTSENTDLFLRGLHELSSKYGRMGILFLDHGPGFISEDTFIVVEAIRTLLIHGQKAYPEGHGKIERFNRTVLAALLRSFDRRPDVDPCSRALELRIRHYLEHRYNPRPHEGLRGNTPQDCFFNDEKALEMPESHEKLRSQFVVHIDRRVTSDNTVSVDSIVYEVPRGHRGHKVILQVRILDGRSIFFLHEGRFVQLHPVDLEANARSQRAQAEKEDPNTSHPPRKTAADLAFERDLGPVVDPDGGFRPPVPQED